MYQTDIPAYETFGQTVREAHASGLPVVAPVAGGPRDLVEPGRTGYLVPPCESGPLTGAVAELAGSARLRAAMGLAARVAVADRTWAAVGDELIEHYHAVAGLMVDQQDLGVVLRRAVHDL